MPEQSRQLSWPRSWSAVFDIVPALIAAVECSFGAYRAAAFLQLTGRLPMLLGVGGLVAGSVLLVRRRYPLGAAVFATALAVIGIGSTFMFPVAMYTLAVYGKSRRVLLVVASVAALLIVASSSIPFGILLAQGLSKATFFQLGGILVAVLSVVAPLVMSVLLGLYVVTRGRLVATLQERTEQLEREQALLAERAERVERERWLLTERTRIARDMHDVVAHRVSLMVVHAGAVETVAAKDPESAAEGAHLVGDMGRQALDELRQILGVLRRGDAPDAEIEMRQPALEGIAVLVEQSCAAGMDIGLTVKGERQPAGMMTMTEYTAYRVVQEALTNVHKHAGSPRVEVVLHYRPKGLDVVVDNAPPTQPPSLALPSGGHGLVGMRERVTALAGTFSAGRRDDGGFRVAVGIPYRASPAPDVPGVGGTASSGLLLDESQADASDPQPVSDGSAVGPAAGPAD